MLTHYSAALSGQVINARRYLTVMLKALWAYESLLAPKMQKHRKAGYRPAFLYEAKESSERAKELIEKYFLLKLLQIIRVTIRIHYRNNAIVFGQNNLDKIYFSIICFDQIIRLTSVNQYCIRKYSAINI